MSSAQTAKLNYSLPHSIGAHAPFSSLPEAVVQELDGRLVPARQAAGSIVYRQGEKPEIVFILFTGRVKMTSVASDAKTASLKIAQPGELLGLPAALSRRPHVVTAQAAETSCIGLLRAEDLETLMHRYPQLSNAVARHLALDCMETFTEVLQLRITSSSSQRLATTLLRLSAQPNHRCSRQSPLTYTHADLAQLIGASRETVTRLIRRFQKAGAIEMKRSSLTIGDRQQLTRLAGLH